ncbi:16S rRNA (cytosine(967)-C(5))-methyltransferase RsmB [Paucilactobacillus suebicus]|uniref:16S rRNA (cytosine(967)-C(5))-methyltransferase n=1 Tax=Paucilactobacillus suebicus DSM 5007 = KCTC 3549 TaxID=1423807 RepID=A0A0R1WE88_9LACO|nr:16S rRNA (cytosine(967)-C(5))-methyltransferase RsmB [Paucilactobacillus suebicus]KRM13158.1 16S rRNA methyltransferase B [Paucilactobacillus suebicus DSM 5007 = KCTC 3549]
MNNEASKTKQSVRFLALEALDKVLLSGAYSNLQLNQVIAQAHLSDADRRLLTNIVYGVIQHRITLEYWLAPFIKGKKLESWVQVLLLMSLYQYKYLDKVPEWAITDESIKIAKIKGHPGIRKLVTAVLHNILRQGVRSFDQLQDQTTRLSTEYSVPSWLIDELASQYGDSKTHEILKKINQPAHQSIRVKQSADTEQVIKSLEDDGFSVKRSTVTSYALIISGKSAAESPLFRDGTITIQDESAMLAVDSMKINPGDQVLDACAAPGGKTIQIAEHLDINNGGKVTALDIHQHKIKLIKDNAKRMHTNSVIDAIQLDARKVSEKFADESFDRILVDAPCSGFGLIRRKPEIRYEKTLEDSFHLQTIQLNILDAVATKVKKGGIITYSTCTILQQENNQVVNKFLQSHPDFTLQKTETSNQLFNDREDKTLTILPSDFDSDGFFVATLKRNQ